MASAEDDDSGGFAVPLWAVAVVVVAVFVVSALIGGTVLLVVVGTMVDDGAEAGSGGDASGATPTPGAATPTPDATTPVPEREPSYSIRIDYRGSWQGAVSLTGGGSSTSESISGSGPTTIEITGEPDIVSANAQKQDGGGGTLTIQIRHDGEIVGQASTSAEYGVAQVSESFY